MTPAVTAKALIRFAKVERSTSVRIGYASEKDTDAAGHMLDRIDKRPIDLHFDWGRFWTSHRRSPHHYNRSRCGRFRSFLVHGNEGLVKDIRDVEIIIRLAWRHFVEICATSRNIECAFHSKRLKFFRERNGRRFQFELWQMQIHISRFELCASS